MSYLAHKHNTTPSETLVSLATSLISTKQLEHLYLALSSHSKPLQLSQPQLERVWSAWFDWHLNPFHVRSIEIEQDFNVQDCKILLDEMLFHFGDPLSPSASQSFQHFIAQKLNSNYLWHSHLHPKNHPIYHATVNLLLNPIKLKSSHILSWINDYYDKSEIRSHLIVFALRMPDYLSAYAESLLSSPGFFIHGKYASEVHSIPAPLLDVSLSAHYVGLLKKHGHSFLDNKDHPGLDHLVCRQFFPPIGLESRAPFVTVADGHRILGLFTAALKTIEMDTKKCFSAKFLRFHDFPDEEWLKPFDRQFTSVSVDPLYTNFLP